MNLKEKIKNDLRQALKKRDERRISTLRMLNNALINLEITQKRRKLDDQAIQKTIQSEVKKRRDSIEAFQKGNRDDLVKKESEELEILKEYLPAELSQEEIREIVQKIISGLEDKSPKNFGQVMGQVMKEVQGRAEGKIVSQIVKEELNK